MSTLNNRLQVLVDDARMDRLSSAASSKGVSVGEFVRSAIDLALEDSSRTQRQQAHLDFLSAAPPIDFGSVDQMKRDIEAAHTSSVFEDA
ncbi:MAG: hypothetical protein HYX29_02580 [Solirubrobacterales bacterium]|nr:hypothetical protein [Solirubrobacterales bacterium]